MAEPFYPTSELIQHTTACQLAGAYERFTKRFRELSAELDTELSAFQDAFSRSDARSYDFGLLYCINHHHSTFGFDTEGVDQILKRFETAAWRALITKLEIGKLMSSKRREEMNRALDGRPDRGDNPVKFPPITEDTIMSVIGGMVSSAEGFLDEAIREEFDSWRPHLHSERDGLKTNDRPEAVQRKVIRSYMVRQGYGASHPWDIDYTRSGSVTALDQIMHFLDGKGVFKEHQGPLVGAIKIAEKDGRGETEYFKFRCFKNGNLHLEFKRLDLLEEFNRRAGGNRLGKREQKRSGELATV